VLHVAVTVVVVIVIVVVVIVVAAVVVVVVVVVARECVNLVIPSSRFNLHVGSIGSARGWVGGVQHRIVHGRSCAGEVTAERRRDGTLPELIDAEVTIRRRNAATRRHQSSASVWITTTMTTAR
jgi:hypothetical protein